jgi:predicted AlkP superfamily phosphohydrolase/phosphomutase
MKKNSRIIVIGLDGVPYTLIQKYIDKGLMPNTAKISRQGTLSAMNTVLPEISSVAWSSFMTGKNPAKTGVYGFFDFVPGSYKMQLSNFLQLKEPPIWNILNKERRQSSLIINMPSTYPAKSMNGALISGFVAPNLDKSVYPASLLPELKNINYQIDLNVNETNGNNELLLKQALEILEIRKQALTNLWKQLNWQLMCCVVTGTDRVLHFMMDAFENENHPLNKQFEAYFTAVDDFIGYVSHKALRKDYIFILSDHGFETINYEVYLNNFLKQQNILEKVGNTFKDFEKLTDKTKAFILDPGRIYIHRKDRYPSGLELTEENYNEIVNELKTLFYNLKSPSGDKVIKAIHTKQELYHGPYADYAPDLVLVPAKGYCLKGAMNSDNIFETPSRHTGFHNYHDAFIMSNLKLHFDEKPHIVDLAPTLLSLIGINTKPYNFDGKIIQPQTLLPT